MSTTISGEFIHTVRDLYLGSLHELLKGKGVRYGINGAVKNALSSYVLSVASVEAFLNESFLTLIPKILTKDSFLWDLPGDSVDRMDLELKMTLMPQLLFGIALRRDEQPFQDMSILIRIRNDLVHYKMNRPTPKYIAPLSRRRILISAEHLDGKSDFVWPHKLGCTEGIRWAYNTACNTVQALVALIGNDNVKRIIRGSASNFEPIADSVPMTG